MGGLAYQEEAKDIVDYQLFQLEGSSEWFRGPAFDLIDGEYITFIGAAQVFGTFCRYPFTHMIAERLPRQILNLGIGGAGPRRFLQDPVLMEGIGRGALTVIQVMSGRSAENSEYEALEGNSLIRRKGSEAPFQYAELVWRSLIAERPEREVRRLIDETREDWLAHMIELCRRIPTPKVLLWISHRRPEAYPDTLEGEVKATMEVFPHFVDRALIDRLVPHVDRYVEAVTSRRSPQLLSNRRTGLPYTVQRDTGSFSWQMGYPSPEMHEDVANALFPVLWEMLPKPWERG